ncbi:2689_t:CDS:2, partial [Gigaspora rosea]
LFEKLSGVTKTFEGYLEAINCEIYMHKLADYLINAKPIILKANCNNEELNKSSKIKNVSTKLIDHLRCLELLAHETAYSKRKEFISFLSYNSNKIEILFVNFINTDEGINKLNKHARVLSSCFHPDRTRIPKCPFVLQEISKYQADEPFKLISEFKVLLLNQLQEALGLEDHEKRGNELWIITIDYHNASEGQWNKLKVLKKDNIKEFPSELLKHRSMLMGELAYQQYRSACTIADKAKMLKKQIKLRGYMALCLYFANNFLNAQLYALAMHLLIWNLPVNNVTQQELYEAKKIIDKVNAVNEGREKNEDASSKSNTDIKLESDFNNSVALIRTNDQGIFFNRENQYTIINNLINILCFKAKRSIVCYQTSHTAILRIRRDAKFVINTAKRCAMIEELVIRENLNKIMEKALNAYDNEKYQEFFNVLSEEYDVKNHNRLLNCRDEIGIINLYNIIDTLKMHGFRVDGIAYLLVVLGEVLFNEKIKIKGVKHAVLKVVAKICFQLALNDELVKEAKELDKCTSELRKISQGSYELIDSMLSKESTKLVPEYLQDSLEMPFFSRLEEMRNIARINIAIIDIVECSYESYTMDFLWIINRIINRECLSDSDAYSVETKSASELSDKYINYLNNQQSFNKDNYYNAVYFEKLAEKEVKINKLNSLCHWQSAQENYDIARKIEPDNPIYSLGYARCLLKLSKYTQVIKLSDTCPALNSLSEYWHLRSVAYFKQRKYKNAMICNTEALYLDPGNNSADKHREFIKKLNNIVEHRNDRYKKELIYEADYLKNSHSNECPVYNILSIDGGGIRR